MKRISPALVVAAVALLIALGGTATATTLLITSAQIKDGTIQARDLAPGVRAQLARRAPGPVGPQGPQGAPGPQGEPGPQGPAGTTMLVACQPSPGAKDEGSIVAALRARGLPMERTGSASLYWRGNRYDNRVGIFEFAEESTAVAEAAKVSANGRGYNDVGHATVAEFGAPMHLYRGGRAIVSYAGMDPQVLVALCTTLGPQFAGE